MYFVWIYFIFIILMYEVVQTTITFYFLYFHNFVFLKSSFQVLYCCWSGLSDFVDLDWYPDLDSAKMLEQDPGLSLSGSTTLHKI
jgi:hypothetical protein